MNNYTYLTQVTRPARPQFMRATLPGQIDCVLTRNGTFTTNDLCLAVTSCGYRWGLITVTVFSYKTYQNLIKLTTSQRLDSEKIKCFERLCLRLYFVIFVSH